MKIIADLLRPKSPSGLWQRALVTTLLSCVIVAANPFAPVQAQGVVVLEKSSDLAPQTIGKLLFPATDQTNIQSEDDDIPQALLDRAKGNRGIHKDADYAGSSGSGDTSTSSGGSASPKPQDTPNQNKGASLAVPINFAFNSNQIDAAAKPALDSIGQALILPEYKTRRLLIEGHTDAVGKAGYNLDLSLRRASAAAQYLHEKYGIDYGRLEVAGRGSSDPLPGYGTNDAVQRRVQFKPL